MSSLTRRLLRFLPARQGCAPQEISESSALVLSQDGPVVPLPDSAGLGLFDAVLIKDNHIAWLQAAARPGEPDLFAAAIETARANTPVGTIIEIEVDSLEQLDRALVNSPDIILVDNLGPDVMAEAVRRRDAVAPSIQLEASGGVNLATVRALALSGVDRISVGALTHSAPALDLALDFESGPVAHRAADAVDDSKRVQY